MEAINCLVRELHSLKDNFLCDKAGCSYSCRARNLGALMKGMKGIQILESLEPDHFPGKSLSEAITAIHEFPCVPGGHDYYRRGGDCDCQLEEFLRGFFLRLEESTHGLELADVFTPPPSPDSSTC